MQRAGDFTEGYPPLINDAGVTEMLRDAVNDYNKKSIMDEIKITEVEDFSLTVDDFAYYLEKARGRYFYLGSGFPGKENSDIHTSTFVRTKAVSKSE